MIIRDTQCHTNFREVRVLMQMHKLAAIDNSFTTIREYSGIYGVEL